MPKRVDDYVSDNRDGIGDINTELIEITGRNASEANFSATVVDLGLDFEVYTRSINNSLISGHPNEANGSGRGVSGDRRGDWTLRENAIVEQPVFTQQGRIAARDALVAEEGQVGSIALGTGTRTPTRADVKLQNPVSRRYTYTSDTDSTTVLGIGSYFLSNQTPSELSEIGVFSEGDDFIGRALVDLPSLGNSTEAYITGELSFTPNTVGSDIITESGRDTLRQMFRSDGEKIGVSEIVIGSGEATLDRQNPQIGNEVMAKDCYALMTEDEAVVRADFYRDEPEQQPVDISEAAIKDNQGEIMWLAAFDAIEKTNRTILPISKPFRFQ